MRDQGPEYSPPRIDTIDGGALLELLGPAQGYGVGEIAPAPDDLNLGVKGR
ncbi:MAG: hypothetical protein OEV00_08285 [Acidobacteriota bacterium]|nr:hypothetical protein [Acidobacteriota bacterium]MDH3785309.1 hypothetical protein [Acidobacteriota bacterium]